MHIRQLCDIRAEGRNPYRFINAIRRSTIVCGSQYCRGDAFYCRIRHSDLPAFRELARRYGMELTVTERPSLLGRLRRYRLRLGLPLGALLGAAVIFYFSNVVAVIDIQGNTAVPEAQILAVLAQEGVTQGTWIGGIDMAHTERAVQLAVPELAWVGVRRTGNRLVVEVTEAVPQPEMLHERTPCNIVAAHDAQITDVTVRSGALMRLIGDGVAKGDLIVSGMVQDDAGNTTPLHANADITGIYTQQAELTEYFTQTERLPTGETAQQRWLCLFHLRIPLQLGQPGYADADVTERYTPLSFLRAELPCGILCRTSEAYSVAVTERSEEETRLLLHEAIVRYEKNFLSDVQILDRELVYSGDGESLSCRMTYTVEGEIGRESDFFVK